VPQLLYYHFLPSRIPVVGAASHARICAKRVGWQRWLFRSSFRLAGVALILSSAFSQLSAEDAEVTPEPANEAAPADSSFLAFLGGEEQNTKFLDAYDHRFQIDLGFGYAIGQQNHLTETGPAWLINSAINAQSNNQSIAVPLDQGDENDFFSERTSLLYSYMDRFDIQYRRNDVNKKYNRGNSPSVLFVYPGNENYATSLFEGTRLLRYRNDHRTFEFGYYHRWMDNLRAGPIIGHQSVHEEITATYGSYTLRSEMVTEDELLTTWAALGDVRINNHMNGLMYGLGLKWDVLDFLRIKYQLYFMDRSGTLEAAGPQIVSLTDEDGAETFDNNAIYQSGRLTDKGMMHRLEAEFRYCRLSATIGMEREEWTRSYDQFFGFQTGNLRDISQKSNPLGIGERGTSSKAYRTEIYATVGMAFHFGEEGTVSTRTSPGTDRQPADPGAVAGDPPEPAPEPEVPLDEQGEYLDKLYDTVKDEFKSQGLALEEMADSFRALGFSLKKIKNEETGDTEEIVASIDGDLSFDTGSARLTQKALQLIDQVAQGMVDNPDTIARVHGHTDSVGAYRSNKVLSLRRAEAVTNAMVERKGIARERIYEVQGFADDRKIVDTMGAEARNRRVEIRIKYKKN
jgi:outer membrane protein OmpA-like peptidoglycan-associated protein